MTAFDLQCHSTASDGTLPPAEVVRAAAAAGVELLALTDHDTVAGVAEAIAAGEEAGVRIVPAAELSSVDGEHEELHVLGYGVDHTDEAFLATLADLRADRERRILAMVQALTENGWTIDDTELQARRSRGEPLGRPHVAKAILNNAANAERLAAEGIDGPNTLFPKYLVPGAPTYVRRSRPTVEQAIELIHAAGGQAVWAHPFWDIDDPAEVEASLRRYAAAGLDGVEAFYPSHSAQQTALLCDLADELALALVTGSADFHGPAHGTFASFMDFELHGRRPRLPA
jgi:predicted metal-dependent phosphoesterase TrpH